MGALDRIKTRVTKKNFDNDVLALLENLKRYKLEDEKIQVGSSSLEGSMIEFSLAIIDEIDDLSDRVAILESVYTNVELIEPMELKEYTPAVTEEAFVDLVAKVEAMQLTIDGKEESHAEVAEAATPKKKSK